MIRTWLIVTLLYPLSLIFCQNKVNGFVKDRESSKPLEAATIAAKYEIYGCYSKKNGRFELTYLNEKDSLKISYIGYKDYNTTIQDLLEDSIILLEKDLIAFEEVVVSPYSKKPKKLELGYFKGKSRTVYFASYKFYVTNVTEEIEYPNDGGKIIIQAINIAFKPKPKNFPVVIKLFLKEEKGYPGEEIYVSEIIDFIESEPHKDKRIKIDVSNKHIVMPKEGIFVGVEYLIDYPINSQTLNYGPSIETKPIYCAYDGWVRVYNQDSWVIASRPVHLSIGLSVLNYKN